MQISRFLPVVAIALAMPSGSRAQTQLDLRTQTKSVDFSNALSTRPFKTGTNLPATCVVGEAFFKTNAAAGQNWFGCASSNTWAQQNGSGSGLNGYTVVAFSSAPVFTAPGIHATTFLLLLSGNVNGSSLSGASAGDSFTFRICQDGSGSHTFRWPSNVQGTSPINQTANACTSQTFVFDGAIAQAVSSATITGISGSAITMPGSTSGVTTLQPSSVAGGTLILPARTAIVATTVGGTTVNDCAKFDASGNLVDAGAVCGSGSGGAGGGEMFSTPGGPGYYLPFGYPADPWPYDMGSALNSVSYREFSVPASIKVSAMAWTQGADEAGQHYAWAIYDSTQTLVPNGTCSTIVSNANEANSCTFAGAVTLAAGAYYLAYSSDGTGAITIYSTNDTQLLSKMFNLFAGTHKRIIHGSTPSTGTTTITFPPSFASDTLANYGWAQMPYVVFIP